MSAHLNATASVTDGKGVRLPKLDIPTFDGDVLHWAQFWEQFKMIVLTCLMLRSWSTCNKQLRWFCQVCYRRTICLSKNPQSHGRSKHIEIKYHFIREQVNKKTIELKYCQMSNMVADMLTKALGKERFKKLRELSGLREQSSFK